MKKTGKNLKAGPQKAFSELRGLIWKKAFNVKKPVGAIIREILKPTGLVIGADRACYNIADKKDFVCVFEWVRKGVKPTVGSRLPRDFVRKIIKPGVNELTAEKAVSRLPAQARPLAEKMMKAYLKSTGLYSVIAVPIYIKGEIHSVISCDLCPGNPGKEAWTREDKEILLELANMARAIIEKKAVEEEMAAARDRFKLLFEAAPDAYYLNDLTGRLIDGNRAAEELIGAKKHELISKDFRKTGMLPASQVPRALKNLMLNAAGRMTGPDEFTLIRKDGTRRQVEIITRPVSLDGKKVVLGQARDITDRKKTIATLEMDAQILDAALDSVFVHDLKGNLIYINRAAHEKLGYTRRRLMDMNISRIESPKYAAMIGRRIKELSKKGRLIFETEHIRKDGTAVPMEIYARIADIGGQKAVISLARDISEKRKADEEIRKMYFAMEQSPSTVVITDTQGNIIYVNRKFEETTGYRRSEAMGKNPRILKSGEMHPGEYEKLWKTIKAGREWRGEFHNRRKDGGLYWEAASISPLRDNSGQITGFIAIKEDVTEKKAILEEITDNREMLRDFLENANDLIQIVAPDASFIYVNKAWKQALGYSDEEIKKMKLFDVIRDDRIPHCLELFGKVMKGECENFIETVFVSKQGREIAVEGNASCKFENGKPVNTRAIFRDVTAKKETERRLLESYERIKQLDLLKSNFLSMVSHELRTPLTSIKGFLAFLEKGAAGELNEKQKEYAAIIHSNTERLLSLISELLDISKMEAGTFRVEKKECDLRAVISHAVLELGPVAGKKRIRLVFKDTGLEIRAMADEYRINQVVPTL